jgi:cell division protein FtsB
MKFSRKSSKNRKTAKRSTKRNYKKKRGGGFNVDKCVNDKTENEGKSRDEARKDCYALNNEYISKIKEGDDTVQQIKNLKDKEDELKAEIERLEGENKGLIAQKNKRQDTPQTPQPDYDDYYDEVDHTYDRFNRDNDDDDDDDIDEDARRYQMSRTGQVGHVPYGKRVGKAATTTYRW